MGRILLEVNDVSKRFCRRPELSLRYGAADVWREMRRRPSSNGLRPHEFWALYEVNFTMESGEVLGVVGHNGAGKSTLINLIAGLILPTKGEIKLHTDKVALMDHNGGLNMIETGRENIAAQLALHGCPEEKIQQDMQTVIDFAELGEFIDAAVGTYSLGMRLRLAFSIYTRLQPDLFIVDEALSGGDLRFRQKFQNYLRTYINDGGSIFLCSHDLYSIQTLCKRCILMDKGNVRMIGDTVEVLQAYQDLMTQAVKVSYESAPSTNTTEAKDEAIIEVGEDNVSDVVITNVKVQASDGGPIIPNGPIDIEMECTAYKDFPSIIWGIEIGNATLFPITSLAGGYEERPYELKEGKNVLRCHIDYLPLAPGRYELRIAVTDKQTAAVITWKGYEDLPIAIDVVGNSSEVMNMMAFRNNVLYIPVEWK